MKMTKKIFLGINHSNSKTTSQLATDIDCFKGMEVCVETNQFTIDERIKEALENNKSILCLGTPHTYGSLSSTIKVYFSDTPMSNCNCYVNTGFNMADEFLTIANEHNIDIGDKKTRTASVAQGKPKACSFCTFTDSYRHRLVDRTENFRVFVGLGCFKEGYLLITPNKHVLSLAELSPELLDEYKALEEKTVNHLKLVYGEEVLIWENGSGNTVTSKSPDSICHAHVHLQPVNINILNVLNKHGYPLTPNVTLDTLPNFKNDKYLLVKPANSSTYHILNNQNFYVPRQLIRQVLGDHLKLAKDQWDWRKFAHKDQIEKTIKALS